MLKKALIYLGLGPDEEYEQYDDFSPSRSAEGGASAERPPVRSVSDAPPVRPASSTVRPVPATPAMPTSQPSTVRVVPIEPSAAAAPAPKTRPAAPGSRSGGPSTVDGASAIRIVESAPSKPHAVTPTSFNEAQSIGDRFKAGQPVIVNLQGVERDLRRRLVDFASGLCYALGGKMDRVADQVYLLIPADVEVSSDDTRRALD
ncbi:MAG: cell division protein SepF [Acidimicrobiales bacterium]